MFVAACSGSQASGERSTDEGASPSGSQTTDSGEVPETTVSAQTVAPETVPKTTVPVTTVVPAPAVTTGAQRLVDSGFAALDGQRVGLIANQASLVGEQHLIDAFAAADNVELVAIFAPEHGVRGKGGAGEEIGDTVDYRTGTPIISLYSDIRRPSEEHLADIDVLVYDLQDAGARFYTYISTMGLSMQSAASTGTRFLVLDRPNPVGGGASNGLVLEDEQISFIGQYPIPAAYGMTSAELAMAIKGQAWLDDLEPLELDIIAMEGWQRSMLWPDTGLEWIPPSSGLVSFESSLAYPGSVLFEATELSYGGGSEEPFYRFGAEWADGEALAQGLNGAGLDGVTFEPVVFTPRKLPRNVSDPRLTGDRLEGVLLVFDDPYAFDSVAATLHVLSAFQAQATAQGRGSIIDRPPAFNLLSGTTSLRRQIEGGTPVEEILAAWEASAQAFDALREPYLLYS